MPVKYFFRYPNFPIICNFDNFIVVASNSDEFELLLLENKFIEDKIYNIIDSNAEGWAFHADLKVISPLTIKKKWTKKELIQLFNNRSNKKLNSLQYPEKSLSAKRFDKILSEIVSILYTEEIL